MEPQVILSCPKHHKELCKENSTYKCPDGDSYPIIDQIPRFVPYDNYARGFGLQWNIYRKTQLDSYTGLSISKDRLSRLLGGSLEIVKNKLVLEAGCGAGRFTEVLLGSGASVFAVDLSDAVDANFENCHQYLDYFICQADLLNLPVPEEQFDIVICIGVIQHTPNPEQTIQTLCRQLKPGGLLVMDHYPHNYPFTPNRKRLREFLITKPPAFSMWFCRALVNILWPVHNLLWKLNKYPFFSKRRYRFLNWSPVVDYHGSYDQLGPKLLYDWAMLDTHDTLTDYYKHFRSVEEIAAALQSNGMTIIENIYAGNGVEARATKVLP